MFKLILITLAILLPMIAVYKLSRKVDIYVHDKFLQKSLLKSCIYYIICFVIYIFIIGVNTYLDPKLYLELFIKGASAGFFWAVFFKMNPITFR